MAILEMGILTFVSFVLLAIKLPPKTLLTLVGKPFLCDCVVTAGLFWLYAGTVSGLMAATFSALMFSVCITLTRWLVGYIEKGVYYPGRFTLKNL
jgi:hypothetical protein